MDTYMSDDTKMDDLSLQLAYALVTETKELSDLSDIVTSLTEGVVYGKRFIVLVAVGETEAIRNLTHEVQGAVDSDAEE